MLQSVSDRFCTAPAGTHTASKCYEEVTKKKKTGEEEDDEEEEEDNHEGEDAGGIGDGKVIMREMNRKIKKREKRQPEEGARSSMKTREGMPIDREILLFVTHDNVILHDEIRGCSSSTVAEVRIHVLRELQACCNCPDRQIFAASLMLRLTCRMNEFVVAGAGLRDEIRLRKYYGLLFKHQRHIDVLQKPNIIVYEQNCSRLPPFP